MARAIGLNALFLEPSHIGGTETYTRELVPALGEAALGWRFVLYLSREAGAVPWELPDNVRISVAPGSSRSRAQRVGWELTGLVAAARRDRVALLHSLGTTSPLWAPLPQVVTVHDLIFESWPEAFPGIRARALRALVPRTLRRAGRIVADSQATADDVVNRYGVNPQKLRVVPLGPGRPPRPMDSAEAERLRARAGAVGPYLLSVATSQPHKNLGALIEAFRIVHAREPRLRLVLVGAAGTADRAVRDAVAAAGLTGAVTLAGRVDDPTLDALYAGALLFVYPSLQEGFGLPLLEAMQRGVPVLSSSASSLPEVGGDAVAYVDATRPAAIAEALVGLVGDPERRAALVAAGRRRLQTFSWERAARETLAVYGELL
jgi:glycosyltransferase involved in cell wall biosynthesis